MWVPGQVDGKARWMEGRLGQWRAVLAKGLQQGLREADGCTGDRPGRDLLGLISKGLEEAAVMSGLKCLVREGVDSGVRHT